MILLNCSGKNLTSCLQDDSNIRWFTLKQGEVAFDPVTENYLALKVVTQAQLDEFVAAAEAEA